MELIKKTEKQRFYKLDFRVYDILHNGLADTIKNRFTSDPIQFKEQYEFAGNPVTDYIEYVCVSDAKNFIERLVFAAFMVRNKNTGEINVSHSHHPVHGCNTFMIHGGNPDLVWDDKVYIRALRILNAKHNKERG
jgi:hypothetical protein